MPFVRPRIAVSTDPDRSSASDDAPDRPNVVLVLADQLRAAALGCAGNEQVHTPTIDRMSEAGVWCSRCYSPDPVCTPARASLLTGQYPHVHRAIANNVRLPAGATTLADRLRGAGYETGYVGKWHLDGTPKPGHVPPERRRGFDYWRGFNRGHQHLRGHPRTAPDGSVDWETGYQPAVQTDMAIEFVERHAGSDPFFCLLSWGPPHLPYEAPPEYADRYDADALSLRPNVPDRMAAQARRDLVAYYGMITSLDDQVARLFDALDRAGVDDETLVILTADHGELMGSHGEYYKGQPWEESIRVPLVWRYPGTLPAGRTVEEPVSLVDVAPTVLSLCGVDVHDGVQGADLADVLYGRATTDRAGVYVEHAVGGDDAWRAFRTADHLLAVDRTGDPDLFFNTADDPYQRNDLSDLIHDRQRVRRRLVEAARTYEDRAFLRRIGERIH